MMDLRAPLKYIRDRLAQGVADERGLAAVEFALLLPFMLTLYIGAVEISQMVAADRKATLAARTVADLAAQATTISTSEMANIMKAATAVMAPFPAAEVKVVVSQVRIDNQGNASIVWSRQDNSTAHAPNQSVTVPPALKINGTWLIWGEVDFSYKPMVGGAPTDLFWKFTGTKNLSDKIYMRPRLSESVACCT